MTERQQTCDFCKSSFDWTDEQVNLDLQLRLMGSGLGAMCDACGDKMIAAEIEAMEHEIEQEREELMRLENEEMERHYREHPHG